jgi:hypothetical protein
LTVIEHLAQGLAGKMKWKNHVSAVLAALLLAEMINLAGASSVSIPDNTIYGHVFDAQTKKPLPSALMYCSTCSPNMTDSKGYYEFGRCFSALTSYTIDCNKKGYRTYRRIVTTDLQGKAEVDFYLQPETKPNPESPFSQPLDY